MTSESEWLQSHDPRPLVLYLGSTPLFTRRKQLLFVTGCCRQNRHHLLLEASRAAVEIAESHADGVLNDDDRSDAYVAADFAFEQACKKAGYDADRYPLEAPDAVRWAGIAAMGVLGEEEQAVATAVATLNEAERRLGAQLVRDLFGNPFRPVAFPSAWQTANAVDLAEAIYADRAFDRLPILAGALEDAGCTNGDILDHCRQPGEHARGCWIVDLVLGKS